MGARSLFLCDPYALQENRPPLRRDVPSEEELHRRENPFGKREGPAKLSDSRYVPYKVSMNPNSFLGTDKARAGHSGMPGGSGMSQVANFAPAPASPPRQHASEKLRQDIWNADAVERARHMFAPPMREYEHEASIAHKGAVISAAFLPAYSVEEDSRLLSLGVDGRLRIWDASTGAPASQSSAALEVQSWSKAIPLQMAVAGTPDDVCFLPEGERISIRCLRTGELLCGLAAHTQEVHCAVVLPGHGEFLYTGGNDGRFLKWRVESTTPAKDVICLD